MDILCALLGAEFPKLCLVGGLILLLIAIFCTKKVRTPWVTLPPIDRLGRLLAGVIGIVLIAVPVTSWFVGTTIGLVPVSGRDSSTDRTGMNTYLLSEPAFAENNDEVPQRFRIRQRRIRRLDIGQEELNVYVGDIHLRGLSDLLIYRSRREYTEVFKEGIKIKYDTIWKALKEEDILLQAKIKEGVETTFKIQGKYFKLTVVKVLWYLFGSDFMEIQIAEN